MGKNAIEFVTFAIYKCNINEVLHTGREQDEKTDVLEWYKKIWMRTEKAL